MLRSRKYTPTYTGMVFGKPFVYNEVQKNRYLYNGNEFQDQVVGGTQFGWYDYGARFYDPEFGRWHSLDPLTEKHLDLGGYTYCADNPVRFIDTDGRNFDTWELTLNHDGTRDLRRINADGGSKTQFVNVRWQTSEGKYWDLGIMQWTNWSNTQAAMFDILSGGKAALGYWNPKQQGKSSGKVEYAPIDPVDFVTGILATKFFPLGSKAGAVMGDALAEDAAKTSTALATKYPAVAAIDGTIEKTFLMPGEVIDRYGSLGGKWFSTPGTSYSARSIPPGLTPYTRFKVLKPFEVQKSLASPGFFSGQSGFGIQFQSPVGADILIKRGIIVPL